MERNPDPEVCLIMDPPDPQHWFRDLSARTAHIVRVRLLPSSVRTGSCYDPSGPAYSSGLLAISVVSLLWHSLADCSVRASLPHSLICSLFCLRLLDVAHRLIWR
jgi:hypothetical protein